MDLSKLQQSILAKEDNVIFVESAAASGKTRLLTEKIKIEAEKNNGNVIAFTFTNAAAEEMMERVGDINRNNVFIGTIHSYCYRLLLAYGIEEATKYVEESQFDRLFELIKKHTECIKPVYCVLCDEMQDCSEDQFQFIFEMLDAQKYFCCYDPRQSIYRWRDAHPEYIKKYAEEKDATVVYMNENYRNGSVILEYAKNLIHLAGYEYDDGSIPMVEGKGRVTTVTYNSTYIASAIKKFGQYGSWFVLTRTNDQVEEMAHALEKQGVPYDTFKRSQLDNKEINQKMHEDTVKVLTIHTSKGLEADNVVVIGAKFYNIEECCISYVAATRARKLLVWTKAVPKTRRNRDITTWES